MASGGMAAGRDTCLQAGACALACLGLPLQMHAYDNCNKALNESASPLPVYVSYPRNLFLFDSACPAFPVPLIDAIQAFDLKPKNKKHQDIYDMDRAGG